MGSVDSRCNLGNLQKKHMHLKWCKFPIATAFQRPRASQIELSRWNFGQQIKPVDGRGNTVPAPVDVLDTHD